MNMVNAQGAQGGCGTMRCYRGEDCAAVTVVHGLRIGLYWYCTVGRLSVRTFHLTYAFLARKILIEFGSEERYLLNFEIEI